MSETVEMNVELKSPIERVWHALTDSGMLSKWMLFTSNNFEPVVGHAFQLRDAPGYDGVVECEVIEVEKPHRLSYSWAAPGQDDVPQSTVVTWTLTEAGDGVTQLHLEQSGFRSDAKQEIGGAKYGWTHMLGQLEELLASA